MSSRKLSSFGFLPKRKRSENEEKDEEARNRPTTKDSTPARPTTTAALSDTPTTAGPTTTAARPDAPTTAGPTTTTAARPDTPTNAGPTTTDARPEKSTTARPTTEANPETPIAFRLTTTVRPGNRTAPRTLPGNPRSTKSTAPDTVHRLGQKRTYDEQKRSRAFQEKWKSEFEWLAYDNEKGMFCTVCKSLPKIADTAGTFFTGCLNYRKSSIQSHDTSKTHKSCMRAKRAKENDEIPGTITSHVLRMEWDQEVKMTKIFNTAYYIMKEEESFKSFERVIELQKKNGVDVGATYTSNQAMRRFTKPIYADLRMAKLEHVRKSRYVSILVDSSTDVSNKDLEVVYVRYLQSGLPMNMFIGIEELKSADAIGHRQSIERILDLAELTDWRDSIVGLGADGAATMQGVNRGLAARLKEDFEWIVSIHCLAHRLELSAGDVIKDCKLVRDILDMMEMNYKVYKVSPKLYRELQEMAELMGAKVRKPQRTQGTRWLAHLGNALDAILKNYAPLISHLEDLVADRRSSADLQGKARRILKIMTDFPTLKFMFFLQDILDSMSKLSKNLQKDSSSLAEASRAVDATSFHLGNLGREAGKHLQSFLEEMRGSDDQTSFRGHELKRVEMEDEFDRNRSDVVNKLQRHLTKRFESLRQDEVSAATTILNTIQWPQTSDELESYGNTSVDFVCRHFKAILEHHKCDLESIMYEWQEAKLYISGLPRARQPSAWKDIIMDEELRAKIPNLLHIVEILLVLPISTAACERGFSCMKRVKSDWRSSLTVDMLSKLMFVVLNGPEVKDFNAAGALKVWWKSERTRRTDYMD